MRRPKIVMNYKRERKYRQEIEEACKMYLEHKITFGVVFNRLLLKRILEIENPQKKQEEK